jgi:ubiquinone/menaquinone biosynthesis C-methylase UbiE
LRRYTPVRFLVANAEALPFPDASFDCVIDTFSLCVMENPGRG